MEEIVVITGPISKEDLKKIAEKRFGDMVKGVLDIEEKKLALGGDLHADEESLLLETGSQQENLWGVNIYIEEAFPDNIEFDSIINIRPNQNNNSRFVEDKILREKIIKCMRQFIT